VPIEAEQRNIAPSRGARPFWTYLGTVSAVGLGIGAIVLSRLTVHDFTVMGTGFFGLAALLVVAELRPLVTAGSPDENGVTTSTAFVFALLLQWGLGVALLMQTIATIIADASRGKAPWRTAFNVAQYALSYTGAALVLAVFHRSATPAHPLELAGRDLPAVLLAGATYFFLNDAFVAKAVALRAQSSFRAEFFGDLGYQAASTGALLALSPIVVVVAERDTLLLPLLLLPLFAVYATASMSLEKERQSLHDALTGLPNRKLLLHRAREGIEESARTGRSLALFLLDLDRFKEINDTLGHQVGDSLLQLVGRRLQSEVRPGDTVVRLGGDEFALLLPDVPDLAAARDVAERMRAALIEPFRHDGMSFELEGSLGIALHPDHGHDFETLMQRADVAMYVAKERGTGIEIYSPESDRHSAVRLGMLGELRHALESGELELHYQPKADLRTGDIVGVEALLRWRHPQRGLVPPDEFIPVAEQTGLMRQITRFVVDRALEQAEDWWRRGLRLPIAVNVSARDLYDRGFADVLQERVEQHGVPARVLQLEVTESVLMSDPARAASTLRAIAGLGVGVSLDDFGTGYSSLVHLKRLPVSEIKIDRSFVQRMDVNEDDAAIVRSIIELAGALGMRVVAEGVETAESWDRLAAYGCDAAQGWYLAKAMPAPEATAWLEEFGAGRSHIATVRRAAFGS
jgi:diguanylate cyclase (GGDEF)-like protein